MGQSGKALSCNATHHIQDVAVANGKGEMEDASRTRSAGGPSWK